MKHEKCYWTTASGKQIQGKAAVILALLELYSDVPISTEFRYNGQTFDERVEAYVLHAIEELDNELANPFGGDEDEEYEDD